MTNIQEEIENFILPILKSKKTYLDIGANIGKASLPFVNIFENVIAFEPNPIALKILTNRAKDSDNWPMGYKLKIEPFAVTDYIGEANLTVPFNEDSVNLINEGHNHQHSSIDNDYIKSRKDKSIIKCPIKTVTLDSYNFKNVDFIKIDVEGSEINVIKGGIETLKRCKPILYFEHKSKSEHKAQIFEILKNIGYTTRHSFAEWRQKKDYKGKRKFKCDMIAIPK